MNILIAPFINALFGFYYLTGSLGWSVVIVTIIIKALLFPLIFPSLKSAEKMRELQPKLKKLQEKYKEDKQKLATAQMDLYKSEGVNPMAGCLPQLLQIGVLLLFFSAFNQVSMFSNGNGDMRVLNDNLLPFLRMEEGFKFSTQFLGSDLSVTPANVFGGGVGLGLVLPLVLLVGSALAQFFSSKLMMPAPKVAENIADKTQDKEDDMMAAMRTQSTYMMPLMTLFIGWNFSLGILLYWFINSVVSLGQQIVVNRIMGKK